MIICIISSSYLPEIGGVELVTHSLSHELINQGHRVHIITPKMGDSTEIIDEGIIVHRLIVPRYPSGNGYRDFLPGLVFYLKAIICIRKVHPDVIQVQNIINIIPAYFAKVLYNIPYCMCFHGSISASLTSILLPQCLRKYWYKLPYIRHLGKLILLTDSEINTVSRDFHLNPVVIPNGIDFSIFYSEPPTSLERTEHRIICASRIVPGKGLEDVITAMPGIISAYPQTKLIIVGDGELLTELQKMVSQMSLSSHVMFRGFVPHDEMGTYYRGAHIFVSASLSEGLSVSMLEAMSCGLPLIVTPTGGADTIISQWNNGILIPYHSPDEISKAVISILSNANCRDIMAENSRNCAKKYAWEEISKKYLQMYDELKTSIKL